MTRITQTRIRFREAVAEAESAGIVLIPRTPRSWLVVNLPGWHVYDSGSDEFPVGYEHVDDGREYGTVETLTRAVGEMRADDAERASMVACTCDRAVLSAEPGHAHRGNSDGCTVEDCYCESPIF